MKQYLLDIHVGWGEKAWTIAEDLEKFIVKCFTESMYNRRDQLCGGPEQTGNRLEMWRRLYMEVEGGSKFVAYGGRKGLNKYP